MEFCNGWEFKSWTREEVVNTLKARNPILLGQAILAIHAGQTAQEQAFSETREQNGKGWSYKTVCQGSYMASWVRSGKILSGHWIDKAVTVTIIHSGQLVRILNSRIGA
jgi:hypothetical protein